MSYGFEITGSLSKLTQSSERMGVFLSEIESIESYSKQYESYRYRVYFKNPTALSHGDLNNACAAVGHPSAYMAAYYEQGSNSVFVLSDRGISTEDLKKSVAVFLPICGLAKDIMNSNYSRGLAVFNNSGVLTYDSNYETIIGVKAIKIGSKSGSTPNETISSGAIIRYPGQSDSQATNHLSWSNTYSGGRSLILHQQPFYEGRYTYGGTLRNNSMFQVNDNSASGTSLRSKIVRVNNSGSGQYTDIVHSTMVVVLTTYPRL